VNLTDHLNFGLFEQVWPTGRKIHIFCFEALGSPAAPAVSQSAQSIDSLTKIKKVGIDVKPWLPLVDEGVLKLQQGKKNVVSISYLV
jgi:hypothetical protein